MATLKTTLSLLVLAAAFAGCAKDSASNDNAARPKSPKPPPPPGTESVAKKYQCKADAESRPFGASFELEVTADGETAIVRANGSVLPYLKQVPGIDSSSDFLVFSSDAAQPSEISINGWMVQSIEAHQGRLLAGEGAYSCKPND